MFDRLARSKNIARPTFFACVKQKMFLKFFKKHHATNFAYFCLSGDVWSLRPPFQHCSTNISFVFDKLQQFATFHQLAKCFATSQNIASPIYFAWDKHKMFLKFFKNIAERILLVKQCFVIWRNGHAFVHVCPTMFDLLATSFKKIHERVNKMFFC